MKNIIGILSLFFVTACSPEKGRNQSIFDANSDTEFLVTGYYEKQEDTIWLKDTSDVYTPPVLQLDGQWDFSTDSGITLELVNANKRELLTATFQMEGYDRYGNKGALSAKKVIRGNEVIKWTFPIPPVPQHPEIANKLTGMRATPFYVDEVISTLEPSKITRILISFDKTLKGAKLGVKRIMTVKGQPVPVPSWFATQEKDFFPFIDKYGQFIHKTWAGKTIKDVDLVADRDKELEELKNNLAPKDRSQYGGWLLGKRQKATGNFYVHKVDGKWWMVDPQGYLFWSHGVVRVTPSSAVTIIDNRSNYFASLPDTSSAFGEFYKTRDEFLYRYYSSWGIKQTFDFSAANLKLKYGENWRSAYKDIVAKRLHNWGMNTISAGSDKAIYLNAKIPYCDRIELNTPKIDGAPEKLNVIRDPFHTNFSKKLTEQLLARKVELGSEWCYGYFIDNKLVWGADHDLGRWVLKSSSTQPAKNVFVNKLEEKYGSIEALNTAWTSNYKSWEQLLADQKEPSVKAMNDCEEFSIVLIEEYFKKVNHVMRETAPGKLLLGCRYVTINESVLNIASKYCDVLTFDLFVDSLSDFALPKGIDKPVLIGEFHFGALDRGLFNPGLNQKTNQKERALAYDKYVRSALRNPSIIGTSWHQFSDQATTGRFDGENFQDGLTDVCDRVYEETVTNVKKIGHKLYQIRNN